MVVYFGMKRRGNNKRKANKKRGKGGGIMSTQYNILFKRLVWYGWCTLHKISLFWLSKLSYYSPIFARGIARLPTIWFSFQRVVRKGGGVGRRKMFIYERLVHLWLNDYMAYAPIDNDYEHNQ